MKTYKIVTARELLDEVGPYWLHEQIEHVDSDGIYLLEMETKVIK